MSDASGSLIVDIIIDIHRLCLCLKVILNNWKESVKSRGRVNSGTKNWVCSLDPGYRVVKSPGICAFIIGDQTLD